MELSRKYKALLLRSKVHFVMLHELNKNVKVASDIELVLIHDKVSAELRRRGIIDEEK